MLVLLLGCGYASYYPQPISRTGGLLETGIQPDTELPCGAPVGGSIHVIVENTLVDRYALYERGVDCQDVFVGSLEASATFEWDGVPGDVVVIRDESDAVYRSFSLPTDAFIRVTIP